MKNRILLLLFISILLVGNSIAQKRYFTEKDIKNWVFVLSEKKTLAQDIFKFENGILKISNVSPGYLRTKKTYKNFTLEIEWRWTKVAANSGVLLHIQKNDTVWPVCFQVQQKADAAGDIICMNGLWAKECTDNVKFTVPKKQLSNEKPIGEWNRMKVISDNATLTVYINGLLQNHISGMTASKGFIGFQAEGKPMEFRNLIIR